MKWKLEQLIKHAQENSACINDKWVPSRPINYKHRTLKERIQESLSVFRGSAEAFVWPEGQ